ncbi:hypothetical protein SBV1_940047 [Verrucomicrobia bacterium]|nr:hypothetical protein SBV1_940047 [Verrucomicrobiota bacterium]
MQYNRGLAPTGWTKLGPPVTATEAVISPQTPPRLDPRASTALWSSRNVRQQVGAGGRLA